MAVVLGRSEVIRDGQFIRLKVVSDNLGSNVDLDCVRFPPTEGDQVVVGKFELDAVITLQLRSESIGTQGSKKLGGDCLVWSIRESQRKSVEAIARGHRWSAPQCVTSWMTRGEHIPWLHRWMQTHILFRRGTPRGTEAESGPLRDFKNLPRFL